MLHGAMVARQCLPSRLTLVEYDSLKQTISSIITKAGGPNDLSPLSRNLLNSCGTRPLGRVYAHTLAVFITALGLCFLLRWGIIQSGLIDKFIMEVVSPIDDIDNFDVPELDKSGLQRL
jgi:hypothetical protein